MCWSSRSGASSSPTRHEKKLLGFIKAELAPRYAEFIGNEIQKAYLESYGDYGQNLFDRYVAYADAWIEDQDYKDPDTGQLMDRELLNQELSKIEKPAGHRQSQGLPQRGREVRAARAGRSMAARTRPGPPTRSCAKSSRSACSRRSRICCR